MRDLLKQLRQANAEGRPVACCRLVETRGSTPQKAGAMMLVFADGSQAGTLGGGCVEAEVKRRAIAVLAGESAEIAKFQLDDDYGWDDGLICGGRMQVLLDPCRDRQTHEYYTRLSEFVDRTSGCTEAIVFDPEKCGLPAAASFLFDSEGQLVAHVRAPSGPSSAHSTLQNGDVAGALRAHLKPIDERPHPHAVDGVAYLPILSRCRLVIVGGGHVGKAVAERAAELDFDVWVVDDREDVVSQERFPRSERRISGKMGEVLPDLDITPNTYCLIVTRGHNHDEEALYHLANRGAAYVGMIGSRRKIQLIFDDLLNEGISQEALDRVHAPVGLDIGSQTVPEIAISISAELVAHRNRARMRKTGPRSPSNV